MRLRGLARCECRHATPRSSNGQQGLKACLPAYQITLLPLLPLLY